MLTHELTAGSLSPVRTLIKTNGLQVKIKRRGRGARHRWRPPVCLNLILFTDGRSARLTPRLSDKTTAVMITGGGGKKKLKFIQKLLFFHSNSGSFCNVSMLRCYVNLLIQNQHCVSHYKHPPKPPNSEAPKKWDPQTSLIRSQEVLWQHSQRQTSLGVNEAEWYAFIQ